LEAALLGPVANASHGPAAEEFKALLQEADILLVNGGNPDLGSYALEVFGAPLAAKILAKVRAGSLVYVGRSAGSMLASADEGLTFEPNPLLMDLLLSNRTAGLGLAGACAIRPHYTQLWDQASRFYERASGLVVVRLPNNESLQCQGMRCAVVGQTSHMGPSSFRGQGDPALTRLFSALAQKVTGGVSRPTMEKPRVIMV